MSTGNAFRRLWDLGYRRLCPITPPNCPVSERSGFFKRIAAGDDARGKAPGVRWPDGTWSGFDFVANESPEADLDRWHAMGAGVGVKVGRGLVCVDSDTPDLEHARITKECAERHFGPLQGVRVGRDPKFSFMLRTAEDFRYASVRYGSGNDRVEILAEGRQFVAVGVHPKTMKPYRWPNGMPARADLPYAEPAAIMAFLDELRTLLPEASNIKIEGEQNRDPVDPATLRGDPVLVERAMRAMRNTSERFDRDGYVAVGYALRGALPDDLGLAFDLYADWCARWEEGDNDPDRVAAEWSRMREAPRIGAGWLYDHAEQWSAPGAFTKAEQWFEEIPDAPESVFPTETPATSTKRFKFTAFNDAAATALTTAAAPLIKGILDQGAMTVLYGESNAGKTFVAMDVAYHIATGQQWAGRRTAASPVLYIAAEGGQGARKRAAALSARYGPAEGFHFLMHPINLLRADADLKPLVLSIREAGAAFGLIVVDTLSRAMAGGDENASTDMGAMVKHLDVLRSETGAHLMVVHHSGKDRAKGARGHSLLRAATDTEIEVANREISVTKQRDLDGTWASGFALDVVTLGVDSDGDPVTSCTIKLVRREDVAVVVGATTPKERDVLKAVSELEAFSTSDDDGISAEEVAQYFDSHADNMSVSGARAVLKRLVFKNCLSKTTRGRWKTVKTEVEEVANEVAEGVFE